MTVADLIAQAKSKAETSLTDGAVRDLRLLLEHNDSVSRTLRVSAEAAIKMLADEHGLKMARSTFDRIVKKTIGRGWGC